MTCVLMAYKGQNNGRQNNESQARHGRKPQRSQPLGPHRPCLARLEDTLFVRMGENTYKLPGVVSVEEIEEIAALVEAYAEQQAAT